MGKVLQATLPLLSFSRFEWIVACLRGSRWAGLANGKSLHEYLGSQSCPHCSTPQNRAGRFVRAACGVVARIRPLDWVRSCRYSRCYAALRIQRISQPACILERRPGWRYGTRRDDGECRRCGNCRVLGHRGFLGPDGWGSATRSKTSHENRGGSNGFCVGRKIRACRLIPLL